MLHQPASQFADQPSSPPALDAEDRPSFDAQGYIAAMRATGAMFTPIRGEPGHGLRNGTFTVEAPPNPADRRRMVAVEEEFAARRAADPSADGAIACCVFEQHSEARFASVVRGDFDIALRELARLKHKVEVCAALEDDPDDDDRARAEATEAADIATTDYFVAVDHVLAMPVRRLRDAELKARCSFLHAFGRADPNVDKTYGVAGSRPSRVFNDALGEMATLQAAADAADETAYPAAESSLLAAFDRIMAYPIRSAEDVALKAEFAVRYGSWGDELQKVLVEIVAFASPARADGIAPKALMG